MLRHFCMTCRQQVTYFSAVNMITKASFLSARTVSSRNSSQQKPSNLRHEHNTLKVPKQPNSSKNSNWDVELEKLARPKLKNPSTGGQRSQGIKYGKKYLSDHNTSTWKDREKFTDSKLPPWMREIHNQLTKSAVFPSMTHVTHSWNQRALQALATHDLMSLANGIESVDKQTMKVVVALWRRLGAMTVEEMLTTADIFFVNNMSVPWYTSALLSYMDEMFESLSFNPNQLTRLIFHIKIHGFAPPSLLWVIEKRTSESLENFDINLIAVMCQLFFVGQNRIKSYALVDKIANKLLDEFDSVDPFNLPMLMKIFRFSNFIKISFYKEFGDRLVTSGYFQKMQRLNQAMHFAFTYASVRITHPELFEHVLAHCEKHLSRHRLKNLAKIIWACGTLVTNQPQHIDLIQGILKQMTESKILKQAQEYPDNLMDLLMGLAFLNIYPHDLINMVFDPRVVRTLMDLNPEREKFLQMEFLDESLTIECPDYNGHRMTQSDKKLVAQHLKHVSLEVDMQFRKSVVPAVAALEDTFGSEAVQCKFALPHFKTTDILLTFDKEQNCFVNPELACPPGSLDISDARFQRLAVMLLSLAQTSYDNHPLGMLHCKVRQLTAVGYQVITIDAEEALSYTFQDLPTTQKSLLTHISKTLGTDVTVSQNHHV